jgi:nitrite reductase/ring-hydroxylating ferredoxin subunit
MNEAEAGERKASLGIAFPVCDLSGFEEGQCRSFSRVLAENEEPLEGFIVYSGGQIFAYRNACPHLNINLNWRPDGFLDPGGRHILCALHGALFNLRDGFCVSGPCFGRSLEKLDARIEDNIAWIRL